MVEPATVAVIVSSVSVVFVACCQAIARVAYGEQPRRSDVLLAFYRTAACTVAIIGCLSLSGAYSNAVSAVFAVLLCVASLVVGGMLAKSWRAEEAAQVRKLAELTELVGEYREQGASLETRCALAARTNDLTRREEEILILLLKNHTRSEIAHELCVSGDTVKTHIRNLYRKMGVAGKSELAETMDPCPGSSSLRPIS